MQLVEERDSLEDLLLKEQMKTQANAGIVSVKSHQGSLLIILLAADLLAVVALLTTFSFSRFNTVSVDFC